MAKLLRDGGYSYDQSKHLIAEARRRVGLTPPQRKKGSVDRLTSEELKALRRAACLLSLRPLSIGRFERSSECEARSIRKTTARSSSSLISAQSAGTTLCSTGSTSPDQSWSRRETPELYRIRLHVSACYPFFGYLPHVAQQIPCRPRQSTLPVVAHFDDEESPGVPVPRDERIRQGPRGAIQAGRL